jgi:hypothetical protein
MSGPSPWQRGVILVLVAVGVGLRLRVYLANRSLWLDESYLALSLLDRDVWELIGTLDYGQAAPAGFMVAQSLIVSLFGSSEYALRAVPVLAAVASVLAFWRLASLMLPPPATMLALGMFAISDPLLRYAAEFKQYGFDVGVALILWWVFAARQADLDEDRPGAWVLVAALGATAIWLSHPAIFVVAGFGLHAMGQAVRAGTWRSAVVRGITGLVWVGSFAVVYLVSLQHVNPVMHTMWRGSAAAIVPVSTQDFGQYVRLSWTLGVLPLGPRVIQLATLCAILGGIALWRRRSVHGAWFAGTLAMALVASSLGKFPIAPRLWLFLTPVIVLLVAAGVDEVWQRTRLHYRPLAPVLVCLLLALPTVGAARDAVRPPGREEIRPLLAHIRSRYQEGDALYVYHAAQYATRYYATRGLDFPGEVVIGEGRYQGDDEVARLRGRGRVWVLFSHVRKPDGMNEEKLLVHFLDRAGFRLETRRETGAALYLYDLSRGP